MGDAPKTVAGENIFAIRCFLNNERRPTNQLTKSEAKALLKTVQRLTSYLGKEYELPVPPAGADATYVRRWIEEFRGGTADGILRMCNEAISWREERDLQRGVVEELLDTLPDTVARKADCWEWCWNDLSEEAQATVKAVRARAVAAQDACCKGQPGERTTIEMCDLGHKFARMPDHPRRNDRYSCPHCMVDGLDRLRHSAAMDREAWRRRIQAARDENDYIPTDIILGWLEGKKDDEQS